MRVRFVLLALLTALPLSFAVACGGSENPAKTGGEEKPTGDDTTDTTSSGPEPWEANSSGAAGTRGDNGPSAGDYASMPIVSCGKVQCAQGQICVTIACRPGQKCAAKQVCATPLNYKP